MKRTIVILCLWSLQTAKQLRIIINVDIVDWPAVSFTKAIFLTYKNIKGDQGV